jgi:hypothetical protein
MSGKGRPEMASDGAPADVEKLEIVVDGQIELGAEQILGTGDPFEDDDQLGPTDYGKTGGARWTKLHSPVTPYIDVERRLLEHKLVRSTRPLPMSDQGLVLQYGILGGPGSGKTNLMMHLLHQIMAHERSNLVLKYGGLILDPKAALIAEVREIFRRVDRQKDLIVVNETDLSEEGVNVIDCPLAPSDLGEALVLAARSAGIGASEPFWLQQMAKVFGSIITLMKYQRPNEPPTLAQLMDVAVGQGILQGTIKKVRESVEKTSPDDPALKNVRVELEILERYASASDPKQRQVVSQIVEQAFSIFRLSENACYSVNRAPCERSLYDQIIEDGKVILVSVGPQKLILSRILPSLMKLIFQRTVLSRFDRCRSRDPHVRIRNKRRPVLFLADEYHTVATQLQGVPFGDSEFFSQARQFGALCLVATQSVEQLQCSGLGDAWKAVFATLAAIVFMRGQDPATRQYLEDLAGPRDYRVRRRDHSRNEGKEGVSWSVEQIEAPSIPKGLLEGFVLGDAVLVGTTEGTTQPKTIRFVQVPKWDKWDDPRRAA